MKMVFVYTEGKDELGLPKADGTLKDPVTGMILTAENYCEMCLENAPNSCPVVANVQNIPQTKEEWKILTDEINRRYLDTARIKEPITTKVKKSQDFYVLTFLSFYSII